MMMAWRAINIDCPLMLGCLLLLKKVQHGIAAV
jgi:hypothetical protein